MPRLVAHRGQCHTFPENTLESVRAAIVCGADAVEFDVQLSADHVPMVFHDVTLSRTAGVGGNVTKMLAKDLLTVNVGEPARFGDKFPSVFLPTLRDMVDLLQEHPHVTPFVEIKNESIAVFGLDLVLEQVIAELRPIADHCVIIAYSLDILLALKKRSFCRFGWIISRMSQSTLTTAHDLAPDFLVIDRRRCRAHDFAADPWDWMVYQTSDPATAVELTERGVSYVETDDICGMMTKLNAS